MFSNLAKNRNSILNSSAQGFLKSGDVDDGLVNCEEFENLRSKTLEVDEMENYK